MWCTHTGKEKMVRNIKNIEIFSEYIKHTNLFKPIDKILEDWYALCHLPELVGVELHAYAQTIILALDQICKRPKNIYIN